MVRGLDYYERTAWEWVIPGGGSQAGTISGGGRYDGLAEQIGGKRVPGVGLRLRHRARRARARGGGRRSRAAPVVDWFCACEDDAARPALHAPARAGSRARARVPGRPRRAQRSRGSCATPSGCGARVITVCRAGDGERGIVRHGEAEIAFGDLVDYVERSVREQ